MVDKYGKNYVPPSRSYTELRASKGDKWAEQTVAEKGWGTTTTSGGGGGSGGGYVPPGSTTNIHSGISQAEINKLQAQAQLLYPGVRPGALQTYYTPEQRVYQGASAEKAIQSYRTSAFQPGVIQAVKDVEAGAKGKIAPGVRETQQQYGVYRTPTRDTGTGTGKVTGVSANAFTLGKTDTGTTRKLASDLPGEVTQLPTIIKGDELTQIPKSSKDIFIYTTGDRGYNIEPLNKPKESDFIPKAYVPSDIERTQAFLKRTEDSSFFKGGTGTIGTPTITQPTSKDIMKDYLPGYEAYSFYKQVGKGFKEGGFKGAITAGKEEIKSDIKREKEALDFYKREYYATRYDPTGLKRKREAESGFFTGLLYPLRKEAERLGGKSRITSETLKGEAQSKAITKYENIPEQYIKEQDIFAKDVEKYKAAPTEAEYNRLLKEEERLQKLYESTKSQMKSFNFEKEFKTEWGKVPLWTKAKGEFFKPETLDIAFGLTRIGIDKGISKVEKLRTPQYEIRDISLTKELPKTPGMEKGYKYFDIKAFAELKTPKGLFSYEKDIIPLRGVARGTPAKFEGIEIGPKGISQIQLSTRSGLKTVEVPTTETGGYADIFAKGVKPFYMENVYVGKLGDLESLGISKGVGFKGGKTFEFGFGRASIKTGSNIIQKPLRWDISLVRPLKGGNVYAEFPREMRSLKDMFDVTKGLKTRSYFFKEKGIVGPRFNINQFYKGYRGAKIGQLQQFKIKDEGLKLSKVIPEKGLFETRLLKKQPFKIVEVTEKDIGGGLVQKTKQTKKVQSLRSVFSQQSVAKETLEPLVKARKSQMKSMSQFETGPIIKLKIGVRERSIMKTAFKTEQESESLLKSKGLLQPLFKQQLKQLQFQKQIIEPKQLQQQKLLEIPSPISPTFMGGPLERLPPFSLPPIIPFPGLPGFGGRPSRRGTWFTKPKARYAPSVWAVTFGKKSLKGYKELKGESYSGLEVRGIPKDWLAPSKTRLL